MTESAAAELARVANDWDQAMVSNDPRVIGQFMADDWILIGPDGSVDTKPRFLALIGSGVGVIVVTLVSAMLGTWLYGQLRPRLPH